MKKAILIVLIIGIFLIIFFLLNQLIQIKQEGYFQIQNQSNPILTYTPTFSPTPKPSPILNDYGNCKSNADCVGSTSCVLGKCMANSCNSDSDCIGGWYCKNGKCAIVNGTNIFQK